MLGGSLGLILFGGGGEPVIIPNIPSRHPRINPPMVVVPCLYRCLVGVTFWRFPCAGKALAPNALHHPFTFLNIHARTTAPMDVAKNSAVTQAIWTGDSWVIDAANLSFLFAWRLRLQDRQSGASTTHRHHAAQQLCGFSRRVNSLHRDSVASPIPCP